MVTKTITVTEAAYEALKAKKEGSESFSRMILRITNKKPLDYFFGILSGKEGEEFEKTIYDLRKQRNKGHKERLSHIAKELSDEM